MFKGNSMDARTRGKLGEARAAAWLRRRFWQIVERNFSCRMGEIDIIARNRRHVIFVEVKLRRNADFAQAREHVTPAKQQRIAAAASLWLAQHPTSLQPRFDVMEVYDDGAAFRINHIENAFEA